eukprot:15465329-Alexandrium_andersonii.AAC.1
MAPMNSLDTAHRRASFIFETDANAVDRIAALFYHTPSNSAAKSRNPVSQCSQRVRVQRNAPGKSETPIVTRARSQTQKPLHS